MGGEGAVELSRRIREDSDRLLSSTTEVVKMLEDLEEIFEPFKIDKNPGDPTGTINPNQRHAKLWGGLMFLMKRALFICALATVYGAVLYILLIAVTECAFIC